MESRVESWLAARAPATPVVCFRILFALCWLAYDLADLALGGTRLALTVGVRPAVVPGLAPLQGMLALGEVALLLGWRVRLVCFLLAALRLLEIGVTLRLNDFFFYIVVVILLSGATPTQGETATGDSSSNADAPAPTGSAATTDMDFASPTGAAAATVPRWVADLLRWQIAWIYFATGLLKLSPAWLGGGHLYVRHQYLSALGWPYPSFTSACLGSLTCNAVLAWAGVLGELCLSALLFLRRAPRLARLLALALHGYAALALNVWFFSLSMIAAVWAVTWGQATFFRARSLLARRSIATPHAASHVPEKK